MTDSNSAYGLDIGLTNGALVQIIRAENPIVHDVWEWSTPQDLDQLAYIIVDKVKAVPSAVAIDWTPNALYNRTPALQLVKTGYLVGMITFGLRSLGIPAIHIPTFDVRKALGLGAVVPKSEVHKAFFEKTNFGHQKMNDHKIDAIILAWLLLYPHPGKAYQGILV